MIRSKTFLLAFAILAGTAFLTSCDKEVVYMPIEKPNLDFYILLEGNQLQKINAMQSDRATKSITITGLMSNDALTAIDFRPATGELYGVSTMNRMYVVNIETGAARVVAAAALNPTINGTAVALDFNPTVDRIRLVTNTGQNLRLHPETGVVAATDGTVSGNMGQVIESVAYTGNTAGSSMTTLYDIDSKTDKLYKQDPPNNGTLAEVGALGVDISTSAGFDINPAGDIALTAVKISDKWELHKVNLTSGMLTKLGNLPSGKIKSLAIPTAPVAFAVDEANNLLAFNFKNIGTPISKPITGLQANEMILGIDFRPLNGQLYALGSTSRIYVLNTSSGAATAIGSAPFTTMLLGTSFGFDFNPTVDRIRCVSNMGQNLRLHPDTGLIAAIDGSLNPGTPTIVGSAYTNNFTGATSTVLFALDAGSDKLYKQDPPNNGTLVEVGTLGVNFETSSGFDIGSTSGMAYAILKVSDKSSVYSINLSSGMATKMGDLPVTVRAFSIGTGF